MRSDENKDKRNTDLAKLRAYLEQHAPGTYISILDWYAAVERLGLTQSSRQRLSDLRKVGLVMDYSKAGQQYLYEGFQVPGQIELFQRAA